MRRALSIALTGLLGSTATLSAQTLVGRVVLPDSTTPVAGAIVVATSVTGVQTRTLTSASGFFQLRLPHAGTVSTEVLRIGFRPSGGPSVAIGGTETRTVTLIAHSLPVSLAAVTVTGATTCRIRPDSGLAVAQLWEEARKAMLATTLRSDGRALTGTRMVYERTIDSTGRVIRDQRVQREEHSTQRVFQSLPADSLARVGYVVPDPSGLSYYAPDPEVLLSEPFSDDHCFALAPSPADSAALVRIAFTPARRERGRYDIAGTVWIDRASAELRAVDFRYADLPGASETAPGGGRVEFVRLPSGAWFVSTWHAQLPVFAPASRPGAPGTRGGRVGAVPLVLRAVHETGGDVSRVTQGDSLLYARELPMVRVQVVSGDAAVPASGVTIALAGTNVTAVSAANGMVHLGPLPAGRYAGAVTHPALDSIDAPPLTRPFLARREAVIDTLVLPSLATLLRSVCPSVEETAGSAMLRGTVRDSAGAPTREATVTVRYLRVDGRSAASNAIRWNEETRRATTDALGHWRVCGVPRATDLAVEVANARGDAGARQRLRIDPVRMVATSDLVLTANAAADSASGAPSRPALRLLVTTADSTPLPEVTLDITDQPDAQRERTRTIVTNLLGIATVPDVGPGPVTVSARRIGYQAGRVSFAMADSTADVRMVLSPTAAPLLDTMRIAARRLPGRFDAFEARRVSRATTATITRTDIDRRRPVQTWQLLTRISFVRITASALGVFAASGRGDTPSLIEPGKACPMQILIDGVRLSPADGSEVDLNQLPPPDAIHGIEVFAGAARLPLEFGGAGANKWCGAIAIWTR